MDEAEYTMRKPKQVRITTTAMRTSLGFMNLSGTPRMVFSTDERPEPLPWPLRREEERGRGTAEPLYADAWATSAAPLRPRARQRGA